MVAAKLQLEKFLAPEVLFGPGALRSAGDYARAFNAHHALVVTDKGVEAEGWASQVRESLERSSVIVTIFDAVSPNPRAEEVMKGVDAFLAHDCDIIVGVGGGSPMDCAKGIGVAAVHGRNVLEFEGVDKMEVPMPPLICVPTTGGTSADVSQFAIVTDTRERVKKAIIGKGLVPDVALIDPATLTTMPAYLTACTGIDALVHAIEAFVSSGSSALTDMYALEAIRLVSRNLKACIDSPKDVALREQVMRGSMYAGLAFSNASLGAVHAMAHSLGGRLDLAHGECNAILLDHVMAYNLDAVPERVKPIGEALGLHMDGLTFEEAEAHVLRRVRELKLEVSVNRTLNQVGVSASDLPELSQAAAKDPCMLTNPRPMNPADIKAVYADSL